MSRIIRVTERDLRAAMRDDRYWRPGHAEREGFVRWVSGGYGGLYPRDGAAREAVWVRAYVRDGKTVSAHWRSPPPGSGGREAGAGGGYGDPEQAGDGIVPANWRSIFRPRPGRAPPDGRSGGGDGIQRPRGRNPRREGADGRDPVDDLRGLSDTRREPNLSGRVDQWSRPGGEAQRARDLERLRPQGAPEQMDEGVLRYRLEDGRIATARPSSSPGSGGTPTLEIAQPIGRGRFQATDKFRYPTGR